MKLRTIIKTILNDSGVKGSFGESNVQLLLGQTVKGKQYVLNDFIFETHNSTCQIDHIVINQHGLFIIETKNYTGRIVPDVDSQWWIQISNRGNRNKFFNPLLQNEKHKQYFQETFKFDIEITPILVFVRNNLNFTNRNVCRPLDLSKRLEEGNYHYSIEQVETVWKILCEYKQTHNISARQHVYNIYANKPSVTHEICPYCGGKLVKRNGMYGEFFGCENYPKCKFKKKR